MHVFFWYVWYVFVPKSYQRPGKSRSRVPKLAYQGPEDAWPGASSRNDSSRDERITSLDRNFAQNSFSTTVSPENAVPNTVWKLFRSSMKNSLALRAIFVSGSFDSVWAQFVALNTNECFQIFFQMLFSRSVEYQ